MQTSVPRKSYFVFQCVIQTRQLLNVATTCSVFLQFVTKYSHLIPPNTKKCFPLRTRYCEDWNLFSSVILGLTTVFLFVLKSHITRLRKTDEIMVKNPLFTIIGYLASKWFSFCIDQKTKTSVWVQSGDPIWKFMSSPIWSFLQTT